MRITTTSNVQVRVQHVATVVTVKPSDASIAIGTYLRALRVLCLDHDIDAVGRDDELGRKFQGLALSSR